jgi:hypothetical protein
MTARYASERGREQPMNETTSHEGRNLMSKPPLRSRPELDALIKRSISDFNALSPERRAAVRRAQKMSWVRGNARPITPEHPDALP